jgi:hypothetical protein
MKLMVIPIDFSEKKTSPKFFTVKSIAEPALVCDSDAHATIARMNDVRASEDDAGAWHPPGQ